ncbi:MAG TPA: bifunctional phosphopantothenoylcysteine decarboxylase/phosphopantothenate--cysteine ligase CoaBC [Bacteroidales bacterium]
MLKGKKIIIGITSSIAAYKIPFLVRLLKKEGAEVQVLLTPFAKEFVTPLTLATLSNRPVLTDFFDPENGNWHSHIELGLWADLFLLAPVTANTMAKVATGIADNLLLTTLLSARCPVLFAPAMDLDMYKHPTTQENIKKLQSFGYQLIEPVEGELASGLKGVGRLEEPEIILEIIRKSFQKDSFFLNKKVLVSAGPTFEPIDPVRFIGNFSSGKMGIEIAKAFAGKGARVELVLGPVSHKVDHPLIQVHPVKTAEEMYEACTSLFDKMDFAVMTAAVADFTPDKTSIKKIKKEAGLKSINLKPTKDILAELGKMKKTKQFLVGFALETDSEVGNAKKKLSNKNLDMVVLNSLQDAGAGFGYDTNKITIMSRLGEKTDFTLKSKTEVAADILDSIESQIKKTKLA